MAQTRKVYQLKLSLGGAGSAVWRRITISANVTLRQAHGVIQKAMGWNELYRYVFEQDGNNVRPASTRCRLLRRGRVA